MGHGQHPVGVKTFDLGNGMRRQVRFAQIAGADVKKPPQFPAGGL